jgi:hypothetical protein
MTSKEIGERYRISSSRVGQITDRQANVSEHMMVLEEARKRLEEICANCADSNPLE